MSIYEDEKYWEGRGFSDKYYKQAEHYRDFCKPNTVLDFGCGQGHFVHAFRSLGIPTTGYDISKWAIDHPYGRAEGHISNHLKFRRYTLVLCYDVLEHIPEDELDKYITKLVGMSAKWIILSVCMAGDPNFYQDETHLTQRPRAWWIFKFQQHGLKFIDTPGHFMFADQILIFKKEKPQKKDINITEVIKGCEKCSLGKLEGTEMREGKRYISCGRLGEIVPGTAKTCIYNETNPNKMELRRYAQRIDQ